jgi:ABC-type glycerol-3-phosphate transport system permease component
VAEPEPPARERGVRSGDGRDRLQAGGSMGMMMAGSLLMTAPVIVIFFFAQKYFIQAVTLTGMKA